MILFYIHSAKYQIFTLFTLFTVIYAILAFMKEDLVHIRLPADVVRALKQTARVESVKKEADLTTSHIVEAALKAYQPFKEVLEKIEADK